MVKTLVQRPIATLMATLTVVVLGIIASQKLAVSLLPDTDIPEITIQLSYKQTEATEFERSIISGVRNQLLQVGHLQDIESETRDGQAVIKMIFHHGTDINLAFIETNEKIDEIMTSLPRDMERPQVIRARASDIPVFYLNIYSKQWGNNDFLQLSELCETTIKKRLEQQSEIAMADLSGYYKPRLMVKLDKDKMYSLGITTEDVQAAFNSHDIDVGNLVVKDGQYEYNIRFLSFLKSKKDVEDIYIKPTDRIFQLKEFAAVEIIPQKIKGLHLYNLQQSVVMGIIKKSDAQVMELKERVEGLLNQFRKDYPTIGFELTQDQSTLLDVSISNLKQSLYIGGLFAFLIMFLFLKDPRSPILIGLSLPISLIISFLLFYIVGISINIMSLAGLLLGIGLMIDNSIIVIDNISQRVSAGLSLFEASVSGTEEIIKPLLSSVLTNCAVFLPLIFLSGLAGELFYDQAVSISIGLASSFLVAVFVLPVLYNLFHKKEKHRFWKILNKFSVTGWESGYLKISKLVFNNKLLFTILFLSFIPLAILLYSVLDKDIMPEQKETALVARIDWNEPLHINESRKRIEAIISSCGEVEYSNVFIGEKQFLLERGHKQTGTEVSMFIETGSEQKLDSLKARLRQVVTKIYPSSTLLLSSPANIFSKVFDNDLSPLRANYQTKKGTQIPSIEQGMTMVDQLRSQGFSVKDPATKETFVISVLQQNLMTYNVSYSRLIDELKIALNENKIADLRGSQIQIPIVLGDQERNVYEIMNRLTVSNESGQYIPVKHLIKLSRQLAYKSIHAGKEGEKLSMDIEANTSNYLAIQSKVKASTPDNLTVSFDGSIYEMTRIFKELSWILVLAVVLLYLILAIQFESLIQPLIILVEIPIDIAGAFFVLWIFGSSINVLSIIGIIVMSGIIINDSILKIDTINRLRQKGVPLLDAIKQGGQRRLKSILMTSLTTILAMIPVLFFTGLGAELQKPLALAIIGGMIIGTIVSLYFIPLMYWAIYQKK